MNGSAAHGEAPPPLAFLPPGVHRLAAVPGMAPGDADRLGRLGIHTTADLRSTDLRDLARASGIALGHLQHWRDTAELMALEGVSPDFAGALLQAGLSSVRILARLTPGDVARFLRRGMRHSGADDEGLGLGGDFEERCRRLCEQARQADPAAHPAGSASRG